MSIDLSIVCFVEGERERSNKLSQLYGWPVVGEDSGSPCLFYDQGVLKIKWAGCKNLKDAFFIDFLSKKNIHLKKTLHQNPQLISKAMGKKLGVTQVLDMTAGSGQDAYLLWLLGFKVTAIEASPIVFALLQDGLCRLRESLAGPVEHEALDNGFKLVHMDSTKYLTTTTHKFDAIYIDPMFSKKPKSALSPKPMQVFQSILPEPLSSDRDNMIKLARHKAKRVVVKGPLFEELSDEAPTHVYKGKSIRYDMYATVVS